MNFNQEIKELCEGLGWVDLGAQKNIHMISFAHEEKGDRVNIYFTTMTVTRQNKNNTRGFCQTWHNVDLELLEKILTD